MLKMLGFSHFSLFFGYRFQWFAWLYGLGCMGLVFCAGYPGDMYSYHFSIYVKTAA
ncbi:TPA: hypothetical protein GRR81_09780 [Vibrio parahaemolyticus]|uniref:hypothetical protein n=1 Tax=Vibrio parahaemolyticus TaxID=670 RepID=UPI0013039176|nr:hypothetical protein [Vibrio parahaemolyticus]EIO4559885.1 hypothetical protein [Vibrio parahaemolyticus]EIO4610709.1 hypothetical protein [Vibrio parahaemolyticus]ELA7843875.1 hypothetical protein [Vibrio parahaemolyticus]HAS6441392.1 hypothetical protein [Vibrio parahaemolyticus]HCH0936428.1 hypothetical protein [Vibrio parahaemolyticus]